MSMIQLDDLDQLVEDLGRIGISSVHEFVWGPHGCIEGLDVGEDFFPLWELKLPQNRESLLRMDFAAIKERRRGDWTIEPPRV